MKKVDIKSIVFFFEILLLLSQGIPVTKPQDVRGLLALGGPEESSGYKGYGLSMMVEILCGILSGQSLINFFSSISSFFFR
jgi:LDH2 family malate/lactate/ureidoglycolate dehydrogenase